MTVQDALDIISRRTRQEIVHTTTELSVAGHAIALPATGKWDDLHARHALPYSARGEARENLLFRIVQDAAPDRRRILDADLYEKLPSAIQAPGLLNTDTVAEAMRREYWWTPVVRRSEEHHLLPFHAELATGFDHTSKSTTGTTRAARYKMFEGYILPFLTWDGNGPDASLIGRLLNEVGGEGNFTLLDELFLEAARSMAEGEAPPLSASELIARSTGTDDKLDPLRTEAGGPFCQPTFDIFRRDLETVLDAGLPRPELIRAVTLLLSLHLATYYYRFALVLGLEVEAVAAACEGEAVRTSCSCSSLQSCPLAGSIKFRAPSSGFRPVSTQSPCRQSYLAIDRDRLLALPANIVAANLFERTWAALTGEPSHEGIPRPARIAAALKAEPWLRPAFDAATTALAVLYAQQAGAGALAERVASRSPGPFALQSAILQARRTRLKHTSRDVVNQLAYRPGEGTLLRRNGPSLYYFEIDDDMLFLLVKLICRGQTIAFEKFLCGLTAYGLAPQDGAEEAALAATLEQFGMLDRYSDAGESIFVHEFS